MHSSGSTKYSRQVQTSDFWTLYTTKIIQKQYFGRSLSTYNLIDPQNAQKWQFVWAYPLMAFPAPRMIFFSSFPQLSPIQTLSGSVILRINGSGKGQAFSYSYSTVAGAKTVTSLMNFFSSFVLAFSKKICASSKLIVIHCSYNSWIAFSFVLASTSTESYARSFFHCFSYRHCWFHWNPHTLKAQYNRLGC